MKHADNMKAMAYMRIDGATVMPDMKRKGETIMFPEEADKEYKYLFVVDGWPWVSKDMKTGVLPVGVIVNGERRNPFDFVPLLEAAVEKAERSEEDD